MYYFYYFRDDKTGLYYGGITNNVLQRQAQHQKQLNKNLKSNKKPWDLYQDKIQLITLWSFSTKKEASVYEKQWIINNYLNPLCLNCSVSNSEYDYAKHQTLSENGGGYKAKIRYALEVNNATLLHTFKSSVEAENFTKVPCSVIRRSCNKAKPISGKGRWLFSAVSKEDLQIKFENLTQAEIKGNCNRPFVLINKNTKEQSQIFYGVLEPQKYGYKINQSNLSKCLLGNRRSTSGYRVALCI